MAEDMILIDKYPCLFHTNHEAKEIEVGAYKSSIHLRSTSVCKLDTVLFVIRYREDTYRRYASQRQYQPSIPQHCNHQDFARLIKR